MDVVLLLSSNVFEVDGGFWGLSSAFSSFSFFIGNLLFYSRLEGSCFFLGVGVLLREGELSMLYFGHHFFFLFSRVASSLHFKFASIRDSTGGNGWVWGGAKLRVRSPGLGGYKIIVGKK